MLDDAKVSADQEMTPLNWKTLKEDDKLSINQSPAAAQTGSTQETESKDTVGHETESKGTGEDGVENPCPPGSRKRECINTPPK